VGIPSPGCPPLPGTHWGFHHSYSPLHIKMNTRFSDACDQLPDMVNPGIDCTERRVTSRTPPLASHHRRGLTCTLWSESRREIDQLLWIGQKVHTQHSAIACTLSSIPPRFSRPVDSKHINNGIRHTGTSPEVISCLFVSPEVIFRSMKCLQPPPDFLSFWDLSVGSSHCLNTLPTFWNSSTTRIVALASEALLPLPLHFPITFLPILDITFPHSLHPLFEPTSRRT